MDVRHRDVLCNVLFALTSAALGTIVVNLFNCFGDLIGLYLLLRLNEAQRLDRRKISSKDSA